MIRSEAERWANLLHEYASGKTVQHLSKDESYAVPGCPPFVRTRWVDIDNPDFSYNISEYRIKPESKKRPFTNANECWAEMQKHQPCGWVKVVDNGYYCLVTDIENNGVFICDLRMSYKEMFDTYLFADGSRFGVVKEE